MAEKQKVKMKFVIISGFLLVAVISRGLAHTRSTNTLPTSYGWPKLSRRINIDNSRLQLNPDVQQKQDFYAKRSAERKLDKVSNSDEISPELSRTIRKAIKKNLPKVEEIVNHITRSIEKILAHKETRTMNARAEKDNEATDYDAEENIDSDEQIDNMQEIQNSEERELGIGIKTRSEASQNENADMGIYYRRQLDDDKNSSDEPTKNTDEATKDTDEYQNSEEKEDEQELFRGFRGFGALLKLGGKAKPILTGIGEGIGKAIGTDMYNKYGHSNSYRRQFMGIIKNIGKFFEKPPQLALQAQKFKNPAKGIWDKVPDFSDGP